MTSARRSFVVAIALALSAIAFVEQQWSLDTYGLTLDLPEWLWVQLAVGWAFLLAALTIARHRPESGLSTWLLVFAMIWIGRLVFTAPRVQWEVVGWALALYGVLFVILYSLPSGRLVGWERVAAGVWLIVTGATALIAVMLTDFYHGIDDPVCCPSHLLLIEHNPDLARAIATPALIAAPLVLVAILVVQVRKWLAASPARRRSLSGLGLILIPLFVLVAVDPVAQVFSDGLMALAEGMWGGGGFAPNPQPTRLNLYIQSGALLILPGLILLATLGSRLSQARVADMMKAVGPSATPDELQEHLRKALGDPGARLAFLREGTSKYVDIDGKPIGGDNPAMTILEDGVSIVHDPGVDEQLVASVGAAASLTLANARLQAELKAQLVEVQESRRRLVSATDEARRRVERDLHDGAQQRLVTLSATLREMLNRSTEPNPEFERLLTAASNDADVAIAELRELARGVHPAILTQAGLAPAVAGLADRAPIPMRVEVGPTRYDSDVESVAYFVIAEALSNVFKHSLATVVEVSVDDTPTELIVEVSDDGVGGADMAGSGIQGLIDRVGALGGKLEITSRDAKGTTVKARIPLGERSGAS